MQTRLWQMYDQKLVEYIRDTLNHIEECDDGGGIAFGYQRILDALHSVCDCTVDGKPSITDENGGI